MSFEVEKLVEGMWSKGPQAPRPCKTRTSIWLRFQCNNVLTFPGDPKSMIVQPRM
jgi:hypothetical protein